ncbi:uncharacterized protein LOC124616620 [Schistocerca americana]|uniref:uncharacterized protein LOC124616620 n=1 Tax=Schistocerca americana TaxID=7009 RepID=UPI001F503360|nr:uncharacterized protein LOC124616620 [Schistocerca americana]
MFPVSPHCRCRKRDLVTSVRGSAVYRRCTGTCLSYLPRPLRRRDSVRDQLGSNSPTSQPRALCPCNAGTTLGGVTSPLYSYDHVTATSPAPVARSLPRNVCYQTPCPAAPCAQHCRRRTSEKAVAPQAAPQVRTPSVDTPTRPRREATLTSSNAEVSHCRKLQTVWLKCADDYACCDGCCLSGVCEYTRAPCYIDRDDMCLSHYCPGGFECYLYQPHVSVAPYPDCRPVKN